MEKKRRKKTNGQTYIFTNMMHVILELNLMVAIVQYLESKLIIHVSKIAFLQDKLSEHQNLVN